LNTVQTFVASVAVLVLVSARLVPPVLLVLVPMFVASWGFATWIFVLDERARMAAQHKPAPDDNEVASK
jgi:uncharacterized protein (DUF1697 family)